ncbi:hypothetical protein FEM54_21360 [Pseudomonas edaphica]|jgi:hypothetical protein|uniref:Uncharacterized protein n=1 Tax=Pseudomonas edaphica TaxID=2006980 RepID=A0A5R8QWC2_9PSED|nr:MULTISPECIES: hypothetical protein [Pseudomonas]MCF5143384.1 hypothetical protein [Pseudomonas sp. PA-6-3C]MCF5150743.1 hypothetical protein [Pseudomonas sp. PA-6-3F]MCF5159752.1 hypothetical protein [Pseudomonas sp. PA-6-2E]MCF5178138.1 hypothetical protein [Pseudomonas sp. PA-6-1D]MCF5193043.1 hypothetical protein [Pseudomonas sp. PA-6-1H]
MRVPVQKTESQVVRKVVGLVLIIPLLLPLTPIPFGLRSLASIAALAGSIYGVWYSRQNASRGITLCATALALLNLGSWVALSTPSIVWFIYFVAWAYGSGNWIHWSI